MWKIKTIQACGMGLLGFMFPRVLKGAGVPLDSIAFSIGQWIAGDVAMIPQDQWLNILGVLAAIIFMGVELWWHPAARLLSLARNKQTTLPATEAPIYDTTITAAGPAFAAAPKHLSAREIAFLAVAKMNADKSAPKRDVWLRDEIWRLAEVDQDSSAEIRLDRLARVCENIRQLAAQGDLPIWGKESRHDVWTKEPIEEQYWEAYQIDMTSLLEERPEILRTEPVKHVKTNKILYWLMTSKVRLDELCSSARVSS